MRAAGWFRLQLATVAVAAVVFGLTGAELARARATEQQPSATGQHSSAQAHAAGRPGPTLARADASGTATALQSSGATSLRQLRLPGGLVVHAGGGDPVRWAERTVWLGRRPGTLVHGLYLGDGDLQAAREVIRAAGCYGRVSAERWTGRTLPYVDNLVNLVVLSGGPWRVDDAEVARVLAPGGLAVQVDSDGSVVARFRKPWPDSLDQWTHLLYDASGNAVSQDRVVSPPFHLQWVGRPVHARHHERLGTVSVVVSAGGKLFAIVDEGPAASILLPPQWRLVARDAFSGVVLWKREIPHWEDHMRPFRSGPPELGRTLVATSDRVFVTLGLREAVSALDPNTGRTLREYPQTKGTEEILYSDGVLYLVTGAAGEASQGDDDARARRGLTPAGSRRRGVLVVDARTGQTLWQDQQADPLPLSLAVADGRLVYVTHSGVVCRDARTGQPLWTTPRDVPKTRPGWSAPTVVLSDGVVLVADRWPKYKDRVDPVTGQPIAAWLAREGWTGDLVAYSADTGKELWRTRCAETYHAPPDVFVIDGLVFVGQSRSRTGPDFVVARDLHTGQIKRRLDTSAAWKTTMPHHRCHRNRATVRYLITGRTGVEFIDVQTGQARRHHWTRGTCQFGTLPANGLLYVPPHACACFIEGKLTGFLALAGRTQAEAEAAQRRRAAQPSSDLAGGSAPRLQKGPAYDQAGRGTYAGHSDQAPSVDDWPTYRHDAGRSGSTRAAVPTQLARLWQRSVGTRLTAPVVALGKVFVAAVDAHTLHAFDAATGQPCWSFTTGGRIDSPPTVAGDRVLFGSADGYVYCLRAEDGTLAWRFRAAPCDRRVVAFGRVESAWPVPGSVLAVGDDVYFVAGRSSFLDGGMVLYRLDARSGRVLAQRTLYDRDPVTGEQPEEPQMFEMPGGLPDVLSTDGRRVYLRHLAFDRQTLEPTEPKDHLYSPAGFLNGEWSHRNYWIVGRHFYSGYIGWYFAGRETPSGRVLALDERWVYGWGYRPEFYRGATGRQYHLFAVDRSQQPPQPPADYTRASRDYPHRGNRKFRVSFAWSRDVPLVVRALVLTRDHLLLAGLPERALEDPDVFEGRRGGRLAVVDRSDGRLVRQYQLPSPPVFDGLAVAGARVYCSLTDGRLLCLTGADQPGTSKLEEILPLEKRLPPLQVSPEPGLVGYWKLDEGEGPLARDSSGNDHHAKAAGRWVKDDSGTCCLATEGRPGALTVPDGDFLHFGTDDFTVALWVKVEHHDCRLLGKEQFPENWWVINVKKDGRTELVLGQGRGPGRSVRALSQTPLPLNAWSHLAYVVARSRGEVRCYLNGRPNGTLKIPEDFHASADVAGQPLRIPSSHKPFRGLFDELRVYKRALTEDEVKRLFELGR